MYLHAHCRVKDWQLLPCIGYAAGTTLPYRPMNGQPSSLQHVLATGATWRRLEESVWGRESLGQRSGPVR